MAKRAVQKYEARYSRIATEWQIVNIKDENAGVYYATSREDYARKIAASMDRGFSIASAVRACSGNRSLVHVGNLVTYKEHFTHVKTRIVKINIDPVRCDYFFVVLRAVDDSAYGPKGTEFLIDMLLRDERLRVVSSRPTFVTKSGKAYFRDVVIDPWWSKPV